MDKWTPPVGTIQFIVSLLTLGFMNLIIKPAAVGTGNMEDTVFFLFFSVIAVSVIALLVYLRRSEIWWFISKTYHEPIHRMTPRLKEALDARGVPFAKGEVGERSPFKVGFDEVIDLNRGEVTIALEARGMTTLVLLGPVERDNRVVIERLKTLVDGAVG